MSNRVSTECAKVSISRCSLAKEKAIFDALQQLIDKQQLYFYVSPEDWQATHTSDELAVIAKTTREFMALWLGTVASKIAKRTMDPIEQCQLAAQTVRMLMVSPDRVESLQNRSTVRRDQGFYLFTVSRLLGADSARHSNNHLLALLLRTLGIEAWLYKENTLAPPQVVCVKLPERPWVFVDAGMFAHVHHPNLVFALQEQPNVAISDSNKQTADETYLSERKQLNDIQANQLVEPLLGVGFNLRETWHLQSQKIPAPLAHWNARQRYLHARLLHIFGWKKAASPLYKELAFGYWTPELIRQRSAFFLPTPSAVSSTRNDLRLGILQKSTIPDWLVQSLRPRYRIVGCVAHQSTLRLHLAVGKKKRIVVRFKLGEGPAAAKIGNVGISYLSVENLSEPLALAICQDLARKLATKALQLMALQEDLAEQEEEPVENAGSGLSAKVILANRAKYLQSQRPEDKASLVLAEYAEQNWIRGLELAQELETNTFHCPLVVALAQTITAGVLGQRRQLCDWQDRLINDPETSCEILATIAYAQRSPGLALQWVEKKHCEWNFLKQLLLLARHEIVATDAVEDMPTNELTANLRSGLPGIFIQCGRADIAQRWLERLIQNNSSLGYAWKATLALWRKDIPEATRMAALAWPEGHVDRLRLAAGIAVLQHRFDEAIELLQTVLQQLPRDLEGNTWMAEALLAKGQRAQGQRYVKNAMNVTNHLPARIIGAILTFPDAFPPKDIFLQHFDGLIGETLPELLGMSQAELYAKGKSGWKAALYEAKELLGGNRSTWPIQLKDNRLQGIGAFAFSRNIAGELQYRVSLEPFVQVLERFTSLEKSWPESPHVWTFRGELLLWAGRYQEAEADFHRALRTRSCRWGYVGLAAAALFQGKLQQTNEAFASMQAKYPPVERATTPVYQGRLARLEQRFESAEKAFALATREAPSRIGAWVERGLNANSMNNHQLMAQCIAEIKRRCPALAWRAQSRNHNQQTDNPVTWLETCLQLLGANRASRMVTIVEDNQLVRLPFAEHWSSVAREALEMADQRPEKGTIRKVLRDTDAMLPPRRAPAIVRPRASRQVEDTFLERGWVRLKGAIPQARVEHWVETAFARLNQNPEKWSEEGRAAMPDGPIGLHQPPISRLTFVGDRLTPLHVFSTKLSRAVHTLVGDRCPRPSISNRLLIAPPAKKVHHQAWHVDEPLPNATFPQMKLSLLMLVLLSDVQEEGSGTMFLEGSPAALGQKLAASNQGLNLSAGSKTLTDIVRKMPNKRSATGRAGDVYLFHPWTFHAPGKGELGQLRILANPNLLADAPIYRPGEPRNPVERLIHNALL